jgi:PAS domain S-box-containing protein
MLTSRQPIWIGWGKELTYLYNDPYKSIIGGKHPWALGLPTATVWREIWDDIRPMLATAMSGDEGTYVERQLLIMERNGYPEETYYTFSYSPIPDDDGSAGGIICANTDDTRAVISERQLALLRDLAAGTADARAWREACEQSIRALCTNLRDLPFALIYIAEPSSKGAVLAGLCGIERGHPAAPEFIGADASPAWPLSEVLRKQDLHLVFDLEARFGSRFPSGAWKQPPRHAAIVPIPATGDTGRAGALVVGLNPFRLFDDNYRSFLTLAAGQIAASVANAQAYEDERRRAEALAELDRAKTAFFSNVSHEFRTPLTLMLGPIADALADEPRHLSAHRPTLEVAHRNGLRLLRLVNTLLDFSRVEAGRVQVSYEPVDLAALTADLASNFRSACEKAGLDLVVDCPPLDEPVWVDGEMWEKIVLNLVSNAFKYTLDGRIEVTLRRKEAAAELAVRDTGVGIPAHELPRLFERFYRIEGQGGRTHEGTGIGLALVQELVRLHGGTVGAESAPGRGSTFTVTVPLGRDHLPADRIGASRPVASTALGADAFVEEALRWLPGQRDDLPASDDLLPEAGALPAERAGRLQRCRILVADDNADMRDYVRRLLAGRHHVETVVDGEAALDAIRVRRPDLLLSDVMMPRLDGVGLLRAIRNDEALRDLPVILVSARAGEEANVEALSAGADDYLVKPFAARELVARVEGALGIAQIRREAAEVLHESEARFRNMADNAPVMMWVTDQSGACLYLNRLWTEFTGQPMEEGLGFGWTCCVHAEDREAARKAFVAATARREAFRVEYRLRRHDGAYRWAIDAAVPRLSETGEFMGFVGSVIDITERKEVEAALEERVAARTRQLAEANTRLVAEIEDRGRAEAALRQAEKLAVVGQLTGGVAHDFNNLLTTISGNIELLEREVRSESGRRKLHAAGRAAERGARLTQQLLAFSRKQVLVVEHVDLGDIVRVAGEFIERTLGGTVRLEARLAEDLWPTRADATQIELALLNLATNARDAMPGGGTLTLTTRNERLDAGNGDLAPGDYAVLAVSDTGPGMSEAVKAKAFEPFFTTKELGKGTGLGLSQVYGVARQHGGAARIHSAAGAGTTVEIWLPRNDAEIAARRAEEPPPHIGRRRSRAATILVVDDDADVREVVATTLRGGGYDVVETDSAARAMDALRRPPGAEVEVMLVDFAMPEMNGAEFARKARQVRPAARVVYLTGYADTDALQVLPDEALVRKPFRASDLLKAVEAALRSAPRERAAGNAASESWSLGSPSPACGRRSG